MKTAKKIFDAISELAEARHVYVREEPKYSLTKEQETRIKKHLAKAKKTISELEKAIAKTRKP